MQPDIMTMDGGMATPPRRMPAPRDAMPSGRSAPVLGTRVDELSYERAMNQICAWANAGASRYMCFLTVHMIMEAYDNPEFQRIVNGADLICSDGMPVMWVSRLLGLRAQTRVAAPKFIFRLCEQAAERGIPVGFYGSTQAVIDGMKANLSTRFPRLNIAYALSPPFRSLSEAENAQIAEDINASGARIIFAGLGCPKQERWMRQARPDVKGVMLGVGYAFDIASGMSKPAPEWMQRTGFEWLYRLMGNPKRLAMRYLRTNPRYLAQAALQVLGIRPYRLDPAARGT